MEYVTLFASSMLSSEQQVSVRSAPIMSLAYKRMVHPMQSYPFSFIIPAATELSTPPLMAIKALINYPYLK